MGWPCCTSDSQRKAQHERGEQGKCKQGPRRAGKLERDGSSHMLWTGGKASTAACGFGGLWKLLLLLAVPLDII